MRLEVTSGLQIWRTTEGEQECEAYSVALGAPTPGQLTLAWRSRAPQLAHVNVIGLFPVM